MVFFKRSRWQNKKDALTIVCGDLKSVSINSGV